MMSGAVAKGKGEEDGDAVGLRSVEAIFERGAGGGWCAPCWLIFSSAV